MLCHFQYCPKNNESWPDLIEALTSVYNKNNVDPVIRILINAYIIDPSQTIANICKRHPTVDFKLYNCLIREQQ
eukprot:9928233-Ditylum_brightwellii.AAC.1